MFDKQDVYREYIKNRIVYLLKLYSEMSKLSREEFLLIFNIRDFEKFLKNREKQIQLI